MIRRSPAPSDLRRLDVLALLDRQCLAADDAADGRPAEEDDDPDRHCEARADERDQRDREQQEREGEDHVHRTGQEGVDGTTEVARRHPDQHADRAGERARDNARDQRDASAVGDTNEHVAAEVVGAEPERRARPVRQAGGGQPSGQMLIVRPVPSDVRDQRRQDREQGDQQDDCRAADGDAVTAEPSPGEPPRAASFDSRAACTRIGLERQLRRFSQNLAHRSTFDCPRLRCGAGQVGTCAICEPPPSLRLIAPPQLRRRRAARARPGSGTPPRAPPPLHV